MAKVHSFDVFDTSLIRKIASPPDVFRLMGGCLAQKLSVVDQAKFVEDFLAARMRAEQETKKDRQETSLDQIWMTLREMIPQLPATVGAQDELNIERKLLLPNAAVAKQISQLRSEGARIIFTSDTYFPQEFIQQQLVRYGLTKPGDGIYTSSTAGVAKWSGELFKIILDREGISARDLHHYGDDPHSDFIMPRRLGIGATLLTHSRLNTWENAIISKNVQHRTATSLLAGSMRSFRLSAGFQSTNGVDELVATFLGPALLVWAAWVLRTAQRDGIRRLYFASRDAYLLCRAASALAANFGSIDCRHLRISRQSTLLPATEEIRASEMLWLRRPWHPVALSFLVKKLGLNWPDVAQYFSTMTKDQGELWSLTTQNEWQEFWNILMSEPVANLLREQIRIKRANILAYLRGEGLCDNVPAGVVDLGWYVEVHASLRKLLEHHEGVSAPRAYYLGLCLTRRAPADAGEVTALFYEQPPYHNWIARQYEVFRRLDVLDHLVGLAPYGSVSEYKANGSIVEAVGPSEPDSHVELVSKIGDAIEVFCKRNYDDALHYADDATAREIIDTLFRAWCVHPNKAALNALDHIMVTDGADLPSRPLLKSWRLFDAFKMLVPGPLREKLRVKTFDPVWPEAAFVRSGPLTQFILRLAAVLRLLRGRSDLELLAFFFKGRR